MSTKPINSPVLYVFENDLRLEDNALFSQACSQALADGTGLLCLYCVQPLQFKSSAWQSDAAMGAARFSFLRQTLADLKTQLADQGLSLLVCIGATEDVLSGLHHKHQFGHIFHSQSAGHHERSAWKKLYPKFPSVRFHTAHINSLFGPNELPFALHDLPKHFTPFRKKVEHLSYQQPTPKPSAYPQACGQSQDHWAQIAAINAKQSTVSQLSGGSTAGQQHLLDYFSSSAASSYKQVRNELKGWSNSTKFSPWLALGCLSPRQIMQQLKRYENQQGANESTYWIYFELLWREFFYWNAHKQGAELFQNNAQEKGQPLISKQLEKWQQGQTGEPLIDACMRELNHTGYLSNRGRQIAASYWIHELAGDWRLGASHFERLLIDYDVASNWGNWQYIAGVGTDPRGGRHFNLKKQQQTHDPENLYSKHWSEFEALMPDICWHVLESA